MRVIAMIVFFMLVIANLVTISAQAQLKYVYEPSP